VTNVRAAAIAIIMALTAGCATHHKGFTAPTAARTLDLFRQDVAAAERHDGHTVCATAEYPDQCQHDLAASPWPKLNDVRAAGVRLVDANRVVHVCGHANGQSFESDFPVTQEPDGRIGAINPLFWMPMTFVPEPTQGAPVSPSTSPPLAQC
jgi:hypothetical protein